MTQGKCLIVLEGLISHNDHLSHGDDHRSSGEITSP